jgi:hypothetical protein
MAHSLRKRYGLDTDAGDKEHRMAFNSTSDSPVVYADCIETNY